MGFTSKRKIACRCCLLAVSRLRFRTFTGALLNGATLFPFSVREHGVRELGRWLGQEAITLYASTPILFRSLAGTLKGQAAFPHLRLMKLGGELVTRKDVELYKSFAPPKCLLHVSLGSTEMSSIRQYNLDKDTPLAGDTVPVGYEQDSQVKMHGYRMELGEVEAALAQHPAVKATAVKVVERPKIKSWQRIW